MKAIRFLFVTTLTVGLIYLLDTSIVINGNSIPPMGKLLNPQTGFWQNSEKPKFEAPEYYRFKSLGENLEVYYDERLVPHIFAENDYDLYFAQGFVTAYHRLFQMDFQTRAAAGRMSEVLYPQLGNKVVAFDQKQRRLGMLHAAEVALESFKNDAVSKNVIDAYTDGVNAYISSLSYKDYPVEYKLLNFKPEPWTPLKCALLLKYMADMLTGNSIDIQLTNIAMEFGMDFVNLLYPDFPDSIIAPVIPKGTIYEKDTIFPIRPQNPWFPLSLNPMVEVENEAGIGSNNWAVAPSKTKNGRPILANDPHLAMNLPSIWFEVQLHTPQVNSYGASLPGAPGVIIGFNQHIAWGVTNGAMDVKDWYHITFKDAKRSEYLVDGSWIKSETRIEKIFRKGDKNPVIDTVIVTRYGPVVYDRNMMIASTSNNLAMKWAGHFPSNELMTFYKLNRATNYEEYVEAISYFKCPSQNFVFASVSGDIALWQQGYFPKKWPEQGRFIMDGSNSLTDWQHFVPNHNNPHQFNPDRGFVSSANQHGVDRSYPYYFTGIYEFYRNRRINEVLEKSSKITVEDMMKLQLDNYNYYAKEGLPTMLEHLNKENLDSEQKAYLSELENWDFFNEKNYQAPAIYEIWLNLTKEITFDEIWGQKEKYPIPQIYYFIRLMKRNPEHLIFDIQTTPNKETLTDVINLAWQKTIDSIQVIKSTGITFNWMNTKSSSVEHLLPILKPFGVYNLSVGGNKSIVNAIGKREGPSWRMVVEVGTPMKGYGVYPGGQSGNPGSVYYKNFIPTWENGEYYELIFMEDKDSFKDKIIHKQKFYK